MRLARFYPILDTGTASRRGLDLAECAQAILEGGARMLQIRHKSSFSRDVAGAADRIAEMCTRFGALLVLNDRPDLARLAGAAVHIGQRDLPPVDTRRIMGERAVIGYSTHNEMQLRAAGAEPVDYIAIGPLFETASKENPDPVVGVEELARLRPLVTRPLVAIGGITRGNAPGVFAAGADSVAVLSDLWPEEPGLDVLRARVEEWLKI